MSKQPKHLHLNKKSFIRYSMDAFKLEIASWKELFKNEWPLALVFIGLVAALIIYAKPYPPKEVKIAAGQVDSSFNIMANRYAKYFKKHGIDLNIVETIGSQDNLTKLIHKNDIQSALLLAGTIKKKEFPKIISLGSVQQVPLWLFYRGTLYEGDDPFVHFSQKKVSVGAPGSGTLALLKELMTLHKPLIENPKNLHYLTHATAADELLKGDLDAMFIADGLDSPIVQRLLKAPDIHVYNFSMAPAYEKKLPYLDMVTIPRGSLNLESIFPKSNIKMVSSSMVLLVEEDLHPAIQLLFMMASDEFGDARDQFFARPDEFPSYRDHSVPLSPIAKHYFESGTPIAARFLPFWVASFIDRMWLLLLAIVTVAFPLFKMLPNYRLTRVRIELSTAYENLRQIESQMLRAQNKEEFEENLAELNALEEAISELIIPPNHLNQYYSLWSAVNIVRKNTVDRLARLLNQENK